jgi:copper chaperone
MTKKIFIEGMSCEHCVRHVGEALKELSGVNDVSVSLEGKYAIVQLTEPVSDDQIKEAIEEAGYEVIKIEG